MFLAEGNRARAAGELGWLLGYQRVIPGWSASRKPFPTPAVFPIGTEVGNSLSPVLLPSHRLLHVLGRRRQRTAKIDQLAIFIHVKIIFDANAEALLGDINAGLDSKNHSWPERNIVIARIMHI